MPTVTVFYGLCGSGKSHAAQAMATSTGQAFFEQPVGRNLYPVIVQWLNAGNDCVIEEAIFLFADHRAEFLRRIQACREVIVRWVAFENDLGAANENVKRRESHEIHRLIGLNTDWSRSFSYHPGCERRPNFSP